MIPFTPTPAAAAVLALARRFRAADRRWQALLAICRRLAARFHLEAAAQRVRLAKIAAVRHREAVRRLELVADELSQLVVEITAARPALADGWESHWRQFPGSGAAVIVQECRAIDAVAADCPALAQLLGPPGPTVLGPECSVN